MLLDEEDKTKLLEKRIQSLEAIEKSLLQIIKDLEKERDTLKLDSKEVIIHRVSPHDKYLVALNEYQCSNIVMMCNAMGYEAKYIEPFNLAHTGDWVGELHNLVKPGAGEREPNCSLERLRELVDSWIKRKKEE